MVRQAIHGYVYKCQCFNRLHRAGRADNGGTQAALATGSKTLFAMFPTP